MKTVCLSLSEQNQATRPANEPPSVEKKTKNREKAEPMESLSQGKDQFEGDLSQLGERTE